MSSIVVREQEIQKLHQKAEAVQKEGGHELTDGLSFEDGVLATIAYFIGEEDSPYADEGVEDDDFIKEIMSSEID